MITLTCRPFVTVTTTRIGESKKAIKNGAEASGNGRRQVRGIPSLLELGL